MGKAEVNEERVQHETLWTRRSGDEMPRQEMVSGRRRGARMTVHLRARKASAVARECQAARLSGAIPVPIAASSGEREMFEVPVEKPGHERVREGGRAAPEEDTTGGAAAVEDRTSPGLQRYVKHWLLFVPRGARPLSQRFVCKAGARTTGMVRCTSLRVPDLFRSR